MRKLVLFMHVSVDGYVAGPTGQMDFVKADNEMFEYAGQQTDQSDIALYGRVTYEMMDDYWPNAGEQPDASKHDKQHSAWYNAVEKVVASRTLAGTSKPGTRFIGEGIGDEIRKIKNLPGKNIVMFGSPGLAKTMLREGLVDELWLFVNPVIRGEGKPLFEPGIPQTKLVLQKSEVFPSKVIMLHYNKE
ncbi:MAG TPA: dihydrofolate reductase family protein [Flavitalea sp.]|nr:dihydrofolate reductase family protein [Flavitalea sp.]